MIDFSQAKISQLASTWVGNKNRYEGFNVPKHPVVPINEVAEELLLGAFLKPFEKTEEFFYMFGEEGPQDNPVLPFIADILENPDTLELNAGKLTVALYEACEYPKIQGGEFFIMHFEDLIVDGEVCSGIGLWKVEGRTPYFKTDKTAEMNLVSSAEGIPCVKPQVAALILNLDTSEGYRVCALDSITKKDQRSFLKDDFLRLRPLEDGFFQTRHHMAMLSEFITQKAAIRFSMDRIQVMGLLSKALDYFKDIDQFHLDDMANHLFTGEDQVQAFMDFRSDYSKAYAIPMSAEFATSQSAVKKESKLFKTGLTLDKNFSVSIKGRTDLMERGFDEETGRKYYKFYFENED